MTSTPQQEQKASVIWYSIKGDFTETGKEQKIKDLATLIAKAEALDWLDHNAYSATNIPDSKILVIIFSWDDSKRTLVNAIQQAMTKE